MRNPVQETLDRALFDAGIPEGVNRVLGATFYFERVKPESPPDPNYQPFTTAGKITGVTLDHNGTVFLETSLGFSLGQQPSHRGFWARYDGLPGMRREMTMCGRLTF